MVLLRKSNNFVHFGNCLRKIKRLNNSISPIHWVLKITSTSANSEPGSNDSDKVLHIYQNSKTEILPQDSLASYIGYSLWGLIPQ